MLHYTRLERFASGKKSSVLGPFSILSYKENEVFCTWSIIVTLIFCVTYQWAKKARVLHYTSLEMLASEQTRLNGSIKNL